MFIYWWSNKHSTHALHKSVTSTKHWGWCGGPGTGDCSRIRIIQLRGARRVKWSHGPWTTISGCLAQVRVIASDIKTIKPFLSLRLFDKGQLNEFGPKLGVENSRWDEGRYTTPPSTHEVRSYRFDVPTTKHFNRTTDPFVHSRNGSNNTWSTRIRKFNLMNLTLHQM